VPDYDECAAIVNDNGRVRAFARGLGAASDMAREYRRLGGHLKADKDGRLHLVTGAKAKAAMTQRNI